VTEQCANFAKQYAKPATKIDGEAEILGVARVSGSQTITQGGIFFILLEQLFQFQKNCSAFKIVFQKNHPNVILF
jgi:hypothetical protein